MVVTRLTRNQLEGNTSRGFESLHLRHKKGKGVPQGTPFPFLWFSKGFERERQRRDLACPAGQVESPHLRHVTAVGISLAASFRHQIIGEYMLRLLMQSALNYHFDIIKGKNKNIISLRLIIFTSLYTFSIMILAMI